MTTAACRHKKHTPITTGKQARFFGAEYGRLKKGLKRKTKMTRGQLRRHLLEWGSKRKGKKGALARALKRRKKRRG